MSLTTAQIRGARGLLNWSQNDLSERTGISGTSIGAIESGSTTPRKTTLETIRQTFENCGIEFMPNQGIRLISGEVRVLIGREGYMSFFNDVYTTLESSKNKEVLVSNVDERNFVKWHGASGEDHIGKITDIPGISYRILVQEGDDFFPASGYAQYKWLAKENFNSVPFYVYGDKLAIMLFDNEPTIIILDYPAVAQAYRVQFDGLWKSSIKPVAKV